MALPPQIASSIAVVATGGTVAVPLEYQLRRFVSPLDFGGVADGVTDSTAAFIAAIGYVNSQRLAGTPVCLHVPAGLWFVNGQSRLPQFAGGGAVVGDGTHQTSVIVGANYPAGPLFSWSEAWVDGTYGTNSQSGVDYVGPFVSGISVFGNRTNPNSVDAFVFYDRNDGIIMRDVDVWYIPGSALKMGYTSNQLQAYVRESKFYNLQFFSCGTASKPALDIISTTMMSSDATNELKFFGVNIFAAAGVGIRISNPNNFGGTRLITFFGVRVEAPGADCVQVGAPSDLGQVDTISMFGVELISVPAGANGLYIGCASGSANQFYGGIFESVQVVNAVGTGVYIANGRSIVINGGGLGSILLGIFGDVLIRETGQEFPSKYAFTSAAPTGATNLLRSPYNTSGNPASAYRIYSIALQALATTAAPVRLTTDGLSASRFNIGELTYTQMIAMSIMVIAFDNSNSINYLAWNCPLATMQDTFGGGSIVIKQTSANLITNGSGANAAVSLTADVVNGGINLTFSPPTVNSDTWTITGRIDVTSTK